MTTTTQRLDELRAIVADVLEFEPHEIDELADFRTQYQADSMRAIEILSQIEKRYDVEIPQSELPNMRNLAAVHAIVARYAGW